jgi:hypothetical protein
MRIKGGGKNAKRSRSEPTGQFMHSLARHLLVVASVVLMVSGCGLAAVLLLGLMLDRTTNNQPRLIALA